MKVILDFKKKIRDSKLGYDRFHKMRGVRWWLFKASMFSEKIDLSQK
jgi:hypothetical protein